MLRDLFWAGVYSFIPAGACAAFVYFRLGARPPMTALDWFGVLMFFLAGVWFAAALGTVAREREELALQAEEDAYRALMARHFAGAVERRQGDRDTTGAAG